MRRRKLPSATSDAYARETANLGRSMNRASRAASGLEDAFELLPVVRWWRAHRDVDADAHRTRHLVIGLEVEKGTRTADGSNWRCLRCGAVIRRDMAGVRRVALARGTWDAGWGGRSKNAWGWCRKCWDSGVVHDGWTAVPTRERAFALMASFTRRGLRGEVTGYGRAPRLGMHDPDTRVDFHLRDLRRELREWQRRRSATAPTANPSLVDARTYHFAAWAFVQEVVALEHFLAPQVLAARAVERGYDLAAAFGVDPVDVEHAGIGSVGAWLVEHLVAFEPRNATEAEDGFRVHDAIREAEEFAQTDQDTWAATFRAGEFFRGGA